MPLQTEPWSEPGAQSVRFPPGKHSSPPQLPGTQIAPSALLSGPPAQQLLGQGPSPGIHSRPQEFSTDQPLQLPANLPGFLPTYFYIHFLNKLFHKYLLRARLVRMLWAKSDRKMTQNLLNNEENDQFLLQDAQTLGTGLWLCFSDMPLALPSSVCFLLLGQLRGQHTTRG